MTRMDEIHAEIAKKPMFPVEEIVEVPFDASGMWGVWRERDLQAYRINGGEIAYVYASSSYTDVSKWMNDHPGDHTILMVQLK